MGILFFNIDNNEAEFRDSKMVHTMVYPAVKLLCYVLSVVLIAFNTWNWYLAIVGYTAIEFWSSRADKND